MTWLSKLKPKRGSTHNSKRVGRGRGSGKGQTSGYGHKGQKARSGGSIRRGFEGGQTPLYRRMPKLGFSNKPFANRFEVINLSDLQGLSGDVTPESLRKVGKVGSGPVKLLGRGELKSALNIKIHKISEAAKQAVERAGGRVEVIG
jgi:large subunit ribosomal protein L15